MSSGQRFAISQWFVFMQYDYFVTFTIITIVGSQCDWDLMTTLIKTKYLVLEKCPLVGLIDNLSIRQFLHSFRQHIRDRMRPVVGRYWPVDCH